MPKILKRKAIASALKWLMTTFVIYMITIAILFFIRGADWSELVESAIPILSFLLSNPLFYIAWVIPYFLYLFVKHLRNIKKSNGWVGVTRVALLTFILPLGLLFGAFKGVTWYNHYEDFQYDWNRSYENATGKSMSHYQSDGKHRGMHVFIRGNQREEELKQMVKSHIEWITLVPYSYQRDVLKPTLSFSKSDRIIRRDSSFSKTIRLAKGMGMEAMMKPHIWVNGSMWRSEIAMDSEEEWQEWFAQYADFILHYARLAEKTGCAALCVGTELRESAIQKPNMWRDLIKQVKAVYHGKLVYAANWDSEYKKITFWDELDYIGVQAYFELTGESMPSVNAIKKGWKKSFAELETYHKKWNKPVLFTEVGYKSTVGAADKPWLWESSTASLSNKVSFETQVNCYEALFQTFWDEPWFAGVHLWKWEGEDPFDFTPKNKPASNVMAKWFGQTVVPVKTE